MFDADEAKDCVQRVSVKATGQAVPDEVMKRIVRLSDRDRQMREIRQHPDIQRFEAWQQNPQGRPFETDVSNAEIHRRYRNRQDDLFYVQATLCSFFGFVCFVQNV